MSEEKKSVARSVRNLLVKASFNLSLLSSKLRAITEEVLSSDEVVNEMFLVTSSSSVASSLLENPSPNNKTNINTQKNTNEYNNDENNNANDDTANNNNNNDNEENKDLETTTEDQSIKINNSLPNFQEFDSVFEADNLRSDVPFVLGDSVWLKRREVWLNGNDDDKFRLKKHNSSNVQLLKVSKADYSLVYNNLIEKNRTFKKPMNLKEVMKVINAGWIASKKWERAAQGLA